MQDRILSRRLIVCVTLLIGVGLLGLFASTVIWMTRPPASSTYINSVAQRIAVDDLLAMYASDELTAEKSFGSAPIIVTGRAGIVDLVPPGDVSMTLIDSHERVLATALILKSSWQQTEKLSHGDSVSLHCSSVMLASSSLILKDCALNH